MSENRPNLFIVGAPKAGTTTLFASLGQVPGIFVPDKIKEPHYFGRIAVPDSDPRAMRSEKQYLALFSAAGSAHRILLEASPSYLRDPDADRLIREFNPDAKVLAILRDPVARAYSGYLMYCRLGKTKDSFLQEVERALNEAVAVDVYNPVGLRMGLYADDLQRYQDTFGDAFRVLLFEDLVQEPDKVLRSILEFLGIALPGQLPELGEHNAFGISRSPLTAWLQQQHRLKQVLRHLLPLQGRAWITRHLLIKKAARPEPDAVAIRKLVAFYRDDVLATARFLQRPELPWSYFDGSFPRPQ